MSCGCEEYICLEAFVNPCSEGIELPLASTYTGNVSGRVWFNDVVNTFEVAVTQGDNIIVPAASFNEQYTHELRLYNGAALIDCYKVKTRLSFDSGEFPVDPVVPSGVSADTFTGNGTDTQTFPGIGVVNLIVIPNQAYTKGDWVQTGEQIVMNNGVTFYGEVLIQWENS